MCNINDRSIAVIFEVDIDFFAIERYDVTRYQVH